MTDEAPALTVQRDAALTTAKLPRKATKPAADLKGLEWVIRERAAEVHHLLVILNGRQALNVLLMDPATVLAFVQDGAFLEAQIAASRKLLVDAQQAWVDAYVAQQDSKP